MTRLARDMSGMVNGVSRSQLNGMFSDYRVRSISNGVHSRFWTCAPMAVLFDRYVPEWRTEPELLTRAVRIPAAELSGAHSQAKDALLAAIRQRTAVALDPQEPILAYSHRMLRRYAAEVYLGAA